LIVVDASFVVHYLLNVAEREELAELVAAQDVLCAPSLIEYEIGSVLRRLHLAGVLPDARASESIEQYRELQMRLTEGRSLADRAWRLRNSVSYYDGMYVALAEALDLPLFTTDKKLSTAPGHRAKIVYLA
jgi:predicted nucleic acid-binding protein